MYETQWLREKVIAICSHNSEFSDHEEGEIAMETIYSNRVTSSEKNEHAEGERIIATADSNRMKNSDKIDY